MNKSDKQKANKQQAHDVRDSQHPMKTLGRLLGFVFKKYHFALIIVLVFIMLSTYANVRGSLFLQVVIDDYIMPLLGTSNPNFSGLLKAITTMAFIYGMGIISTLIFNLMMVRISEGTQKAIRDNLFNHLETLPIRYFDSRSDGDIMSHFTNDIDTLRQMVSQSLPNLIAALVSFVSVFVYNNFDINI